MAAPTEGRAVSGVGLLLGFGALAAADGPWWGLGKVRPARNRASLVRVPALDELRCQQIFTLLVHVGS